MQVVPFAQTVICNLNFMFLQVWPETSSWTHQLIRKLTQRNWSGGCFSTDFYKSTCPFATRGVATRWLLNILMNKYYIVNMLSQGAITVTQLQTLLKVARCPMWPPRLLCCQQICLWAEHELSIKHKHSSGPPGTRPRKRTEPCSSLPLLFCCCEMLSRIHDTCLTCLSTKDRWQLTVSTYTIICWLLTK